MLCSVQTLHIFGGQLGLVDVATVLAVKFRLNSLSWFFFLFVLWSTGLFR